MKIPKKNHISYLAGAGLISMTLAAGPASAIDIRSWDKTFSNAANRFIVISALNSEAVLDKESQVVWEKTPDNSSGSWESAPNICVRKEVGGKAGWRLPSIQELASLIDSLQNNPAIQSGHPFQSVSSDPYWSGTKASISGASENAWTLDFGTSGAATFLTSGAITLEATSATNQTWCVRSPLASQSE
ncbi:MAG: DUF1566 domain-containing protein [Nitrospinota bacterium]